MELVKPRGRSPGDRVGIVATSSPVTPAELSRLTACPRSRGYEVRVADGVLDREGHFAGTARRRAPGVTRRFADPEIALVPPANGGTGAGHCRVELDLGGGRPVLRYLEDLVATGAKWQVAGRHNPPRRG